MTNGWPSNLADMEHITELISDIRSMVCDVYHTNGVDVLPSCVVFDSVLAEEEALEEIPSCC